MNGCHAHGFAWACLRNLDMPTQNRGHGTPHFGMEGLLQKLLEPSPPEVSNSTCIANRISIAFGLAAPACSGTARGLVWNSVHLWDRFRTGLSHRISARDHWPRVFAWALAFPGSLWRTIPDQTAGALCCHRVGFAAIRRCQCCDGQDSLCDCSNSCYLHDLLALSSITE